MGYHQQWLIKSKSKNTSRLIIPNLVTGKVAVEFMVECEGSTMIITCSGKGNIVITDAMYGRLVEGTVACSDPNKSRTGTTSVSSQRHRVIVIFV